MDSVAEAAGVSKRTIYNHFLSKENLFQEVIADFLNERDKIKPLEYSNTIPLEDQLMEFAKAELFLINQPTRRGLSRLLTSVFLVNPGLGAETRGKYDPHKSLIVWLKAASDEHRIQFKSAELAASMFYGLIEGCLTWPALITDGASLRFADPILGEIVSMYLDAYRVKDISAHIDL